MDEFRYVSLAQEVVFGPGCLDRISEAAERYGWQRLMLCTNRSMRADGIAARLESLLGGRLVAVLDGVQPHVQAEQVAQALTLAAKKKVQAVIGLGGGSPIGMAKAAASELAQKHKKSTPSPATADNHSHIAVIAIPTTYAGSEMTPVYGVTYAHESPPRKVTVHNPKITPRLVLYDPELTLDLPPEMTASTGINALAHCIEALYSFTRHPLSTAAALSGIQHITHALLRCYNDGKDLEARSEMLIGAHLAGQSLSSVSMGLHHGICHVLGGTANVPHGFANSIMLPHVIRFNAEAVAQQLLPAASAMSLHTDGLRPVAIAEKTAQRVHKIVHDMKLPQRLREVDVKEEDLPHLAQLGFQNHTVQNNPRPIVNAKQIEDLLREAW